MNEYRKNEPEKIDLMNITGDIIQGIKKFWWVIIGFAVIFAVYSYFSVSNNYQPKYVASATTSVRIVGEEDGYINEESAKQMAEIFPYIMTSGVLENVIAERMGMENVPGEITAKAEEGTNLFTVSVSANDPQIAYNILQLVLENYPKVARFVVGETIMDVLDETGIPTDTQKEEIVRGSYKKGAAKGAILGIVLMLLYVFTRKTVKTKKELRKGINLEDLGTLPMIVMKKRKKESIYCSTNMLYGRIPQRYLEAIRKLRIRVTKATEEKGIKSILVTSSIPGEGKTTIAVNLAVALAKQGKKVILVDGDLRNPSVSKNMRAENIDAGIMEVLADSEKLDKNLVEVETSGEVLKILYCEKPTDKATKILGSKQMKNLVDTLEKRAEIVIFDTAPSELLADASVLAKYVDAAIYVVKQDYAKMKQIQKGIQALAFSGIDILGYVFNADKIEDKKRYGYGYGYGYSSYGHYGKERAFRKKDDLSGRVLKD